MTQDKMQTQSKKKPRRKITLLFFVLVFTLILWQTMPLKHNLAAAASSDQPPPPPPPPPHKELPALNTESLSQPVQDLMKLQKDTQEEYFKSLNDLQMLKVSKEIAETNQAIAQAQLKQAKDQKDTIDVLTGKAPVENAPPPTAAAAPGAPGAATAVASAPAEVSYNVVSVSQLHQRWTAVLSQDKALFNVGVGDVLPPDGSTVISINKSGVIIEKFGVQKKLSLVSIM